MMSMQAVRALAPLTIDACYLATLVAQGKLLSRGELGKHFMLISASITLVALVAKMEEVAKIAALDIGLVIEGSDSADVGREQALIHAQVGRIE